MILLDCNWQNVINSIPHLCWAGIVLIALYLLLKYVVQPWRSHCRHQEIKEKAFEQEKFWAFFNRMEKPLQEELEKAKKELDGLKKKEDALNSLEKEKKEFEKQILEEKIKVYQEIINNK